MFDDVIFDMDGTLVDSRPGITASLRFALQSLGHNVDLDLDLGSALGPPIAIALKELLARHEDDRLAEGLAAFRDHQGTHGLFESRLYENIEGVLADLTSRGVGLHIATSKDTAIALRVLDHFELSERFIHIEGTAPSGDVAEKGELIAKVVGAGRLDASRTLMVGDRRFDVAGAIHNGVTPVGALWGYGSRTELTEAGAMVFARIPEDLLRLA